MFMGKILVLSLSISQFLNFFQNYDVFYSKFGNYRAKRKKIRNVTPSACGGPKSGPSACGGPKRGPSACGRPKRGPSASRRPKSARRPPVGRRVLGAQNVIKMASNEKVINMKNLHLIETVDFDIKIVLIRGRMQPVEVKQGQKQKLQSHFGPTELI